MSRKSGRQGHAASWRRHWGLVAAGAMALFVAALIVSASRADTRDSAAELAPDIALTALQGDWQLSQRRGEVVVLYFSFVG